MKRHLWAFGLVALLTVFLVCAQETVSLWPWTHRARLPWGTCAVDSRYWSGCLVMFAPLVPLALLKQKVRFTRLGRTALAVLVAALGLYAGIMLVKARLPGSNRAVKIAACDWAVETIRADYCGPMADTEPFFHLLDYHLPNRPVVDAHTARVAYLLNGREGKDVCPVDRLDYLVNESSRLDGTALARLGYEKLAERRFGTREFAIYRRAR